MFSKIMLLTNKYIDDFILKNTPKIKANQFDKERIEEIFIDFWQPLGYDISNLNLEIKKREKDELHPMIKFKSKDNNDVVLILNFGILGIEYVLYHNSNDYVSESYYENNNNYEVTISRRITNVLENYDKPDELFINILLSSSNVMIRYDYNNMEILKFKDDFKGKSKELKFCNDLCKAIKHTKEELYYKNDKELHNYVKRKLKEKFTKLRDKDNSLNEK
ncbi:MAG: hypothetical protein ACI4T1_02740 [Christensenellales bacterium]